jgi:TonB family protein
MKRITYKYSLALSIIILFGLLNGCKHKIQNIPWPSEPVKMYTSDIKIDTVKMMNMLRSRLTTDSILIKLGPGTHEFYLIVGKNPEADHLSYIFSTYLAGYGLNSAVSWKIVLNRKSSGFPFWYLYQDTEKIFKFDKDVNITDSTMLGVFALRVGVNKSKEEIYPWSVSPVDLSRYETKFFGNFNKSEFQRSPIVRTDLGIEEELRKKIKYPEEARQIGVSGKILIMAFVDEKGNVVGTKLSQGIGFGCDEAVLDAVRQTKFKPSNEKNIVIESFDFQIEDKDSPIGLTNMLFKYNSAMGYNNIYFNIVNSGEVPLEQTKSMVTVHIDKEFAGAFKIERLIKEQEFWLHWDGGRKGKHEYVITISPAGTLTWYRPNVIMGSFEVK